MRALHLLSARQLLSGFLMPLALVLVACATSPTEELVRAEKLLSRLELNGATQYLTYEIADARRQIEEAKKFIRGNRFEQAGEALYQACQKLDSCGVAFVQLRNLAKDRSLKQLDDLTIGLDALSAQVMKLPRQTYVDQNRHDIHLHRLKQYYEFLKEIQALVINKNYPQALEKGELLVIQLNKTLAGLKSSTRAPNIITAEAPKPTKPQRRSATGLLASSTR